MSDFIENISAEELEAMCSVDPSYRKWYEDQISKEHLDKLIDDIIFENVEDVEEEA